MAKRMVSSHYILLPDGKIGRWPILECDENGVILNLIPNCEIFKELPGLELHSGMMLPGLIDVTPTGTIFNPDIKTINSHFANGTMILGISDPIKHTITPPPYLVKSLAESTFATSVCERVDADANIPLFTRVKNSSNAQIASLAHICEQATNELNLFNLGRLETGKSPGVLLLKNFDIKNSTLLPESRVKWLIKPKLIRW